MGGSVRHVQALGILAAAILRVVSTGTRITFFREPSSSFVKRYLDRQHEHQSSVNHDFAGFTDPALKLGNDAAPPHAPPGFSERTVRVHLGHGESTYKRARDAVLQWQMHDGSAWARIVLSRKPPRRSNSQVLASVEMVTVAKACAGLAWCINPCRVMYERKDIDLIFSVPPGTAAFGAEQEDRHLQKITRRRDSSSKKCDSPFGNKVGRLWAGNSPSSAPLWASFAGGGRHKGLQTAVAYATKQGHLIQGEERMRVIWLRGRGGDNSVWFEVYSVSRGSGLVGGIVFPFVRSMQKRFFNEQAETMRRIAVGQRGSC